MTAALDERQVLFFLQTVNTLGREALDRLGQQVREIRHLDSLRLLATMQNRLFSLDLLPFKTDLVSIDVKTFAILPGSLEQAASHFGGQIGIAELEGCRLKGKRRAV